MLQRNFWPNFGSQNAENSKLLCDGVLYLINANYEADIISGDQQRIENRLNDAVNLGTTYPKLKTYYEQRVRTSLQLSDNYALMEAFDSAFKQVFKARHANV